jgi:rubrerythrin
MSRADDAHLLTAAYREESELYRRALALATAAESSDAEWPRRLNDVFRQIEAIEKRIAVVKARWQSDRATDFGVSAVTTEVAALIAQLQTVVGEATSRVEKRRQLLMPEMANVVQADRVRQAYRRVERLAVPRDRRPG